MAINKGLLHECISCLPMDIKGLFGLFKRCVTTFFKSNLLINCPREKSDETLSQDVIQLRNTAVIRYWFIVLGKGHRVLLRKSSQILSSYITNIVFFFQKNCPNIPIPESKSFPTI